MAIIRTGRKAPKATASRKSYINGTAALALALVISGCGSTPPPVVGTVNSVPVAEDGQSGYSTMVSPDYPLRPSDTISVAVFREPDLSAERVRIDTDGFVGLPLVGQVQVKGMTPSAVARMIEQKLAGGYIKNPHVAVNVIEYGSHLVTVEGSVKKAGIFPFQPGTRLSGAISLAEGPARVAKINQIAVFRPTAEGMTVAKFDYAAIKQGTMLDPVMLPGDRIVVGTSSLSQAWQDFLTAIPLFALFTRI